MLYKLEAGLVDQAYLTATGLDTSLLLKTILSPTISASAQ